MHSTQRASLTSTFLAIVKFWFGREQGMSEVFSPRTNGPFDWQARRDAYTIGFFCSSSMELLQASLLCLDLPLSDDLRPPSLLPLYLPTVSRFNTISSPRDFALRYKLFDPQPPRLTLPLWTPTLSLHVSRFHSEASIFRTSTHDFTLLTPSLDLLGTTHR